MALLHNAKTTERLIGFKIVQAIEDTSSGEGFFGFTVKKGKKEFNVWILRDEEGNGPGCMDAEGL